MVPADDAWLGATPVDPALETAKRFDPARAPAVAWLFGIARHQLARAARRDVAGAERAVLAIVDRLTTVDTLGARARGTLVTTSSYATHQCANNMRRRSIDDRRH
jgi:hypothetical protein